MSEISLDSQGRLTADVNCVGCQYNLRGLDGESVCPECGVSVERSCRGDLLRFANPKWVGQLAHGMTLAWMSLGVAVLSALLIAAGIDLAGDAHAVVTAVAGILFLMPVAVGFAACWNFSMPEPGAAKVTTSRDWRAIARTCAVLFVCVVVLLGIFASVVSSPANVAEVLFIGVFYVGVMVSVVGFYAAGRYAAGLAKRIPDQSLASHTMFVTYGGSLVGLSIFFGLTLMVFNPRMSSLFSFFGPGPSLPYFIEVILILGALGTLVGGAVFGLGVLILMARYYDVLLKVAKQAKGMDEGEAP